MNIFQNILPYGVFGKSRAINAENPTGEKGKGGMASSNLGKGRKGSPCLKNIEPGSTTVLADISGCGVINHIWITVDNKTTDGDCFVLRDLILRMFWDDAKSPAVEVPLGDFFCCGFGKECYINSYPIVVAPSRGLNSYFSMPFRKKARIELVSQHKNVIPAFFYQIDYCLYDTLPDTMLYFFAKWNRESVTVKKKDYTILDNVYGKGIYVGKDYQDVSRKAANIMSAQIIMKPNAVLGLATGSTPVGLYKQLIEWYNKGDLDFSQITSVNLDEYKGLSGDNDQSYRYFMNTNLFDHVNIDKTRTYVPNGLEEDSDKACADYNEIIRSVGGIDIQLLGIGGNGHIGFNEPGEAFEKETHCVDLTESTIKANARFFESMDEVPKQAYTMGIKNIMAAKKILLVATGSAKADALYKSLYGPITPNVPASILQLHQDVTVVADEDALSLIKEKGLL